MTAEAEESASRVFFRPFGAGSFPIFYPRLAPWAVILRRFAVVIALTAYPRRSPNAGYELMQPLLLPALRYRLTNCIHIEELTEIGVAGEGFAGVAVH